MDKTRWPSYFRGRRATNLVDVDADHEEADAAEAHVARDRFPAITRLRSSMGSRARQRDDANLGGPDSEALELQRNPVPMLTRIRKFSFKTSPLPPSTASGPHTHERVHVGAGDDAGIPAPQPTRFARLSSLVRARTRPRPIEVPAMAPVGPEAAQAVDTPWASRFSRIPMLSRITSRNKIPVAQMSTPRPSTPRRRRPLRPIDPRPPTPHTGQGHLFLGFIMRRPEMRARGSERRKEVDRLRMEERERRRRRDAQERVALRGERGRKVVWKDDLTRRPKEKKRQKQERKMDQRRKSRPLPSLPRFQELPPPSRKKTGFRSRSRPSLAPREERARARRMYEY